MSITMHTPPSRPRGRRSTIAASLALVSALALSACASATATDVPATTPTAAESIQVVDGWVKAVDEGMTAAFGLLENSSDVEVTLVAALAAVSPVVELHEVVMNGGATVMQEKPGGIAIAPNGTHELAPGQDHIMMMGLSEALLPGDEVLIALEFSDGSSVDHVFTVKDFAGADEEYRGGGEMGDLEDE